jgi:hypothetical protein
MHRRFACINDAPIHEADQPSNWPLGRRPDDHPGLRTWGFLPQKSTKVADAETQAAPEYRSRGQAKPQRRFTL